MAGEDDKKPETAEKGVKAAKVKASDHDNLMKTKAALDAEPRTEIKIAASETQREDVAVGVNGYTFLIQREKWVKVPRSVVEVLQNAVCTAYRQEARKAPEEGYEMVAYETPRFPFQQRLPQ